MSCADDELEVVVVGDVRGESDERCILADSCCLPIDV